MRARWSRLPSGNRIFGHAQILWDLIPLEVSTHLTVDMTHGVTERVEPDLLTGCRDCAPVEFDQTLSAGQDHIVQLAAAVLRLLQRTLLEIRPHRSKDSLYHDPPHAALRRSVKRTVTRDKGNVIQREMS